MKKINVIINVRKGTSTAVVFIDKIIYLKESEDEGKCVIYLAKEISLRVNHTLEEVLNMINKSDRNNITPSVAI
jgi:hypothetical protein